MTVASRNTALSINQAKKWLMGLTPIIFMYCGKSETNDWKAAWGEIWARLGKKLFYLFWYSDILARSFWVLLIKQVVMNKAFVCWKVMCLFEKV